MKKTSPKSPSAQSSKTTTRVKSKNGRFLSADALAQRDRKAAAALKLAQAQLDEQADSAQAPVSQVRQKNSGPASKNEFQ